jgi:signal transduction histidine kinase
LDVLHEFLDRHRPDLIARCRAKVALRRGAAPSQVHDHGIPVFLGRLIDTLRAEHAIDVFNAGLSQPPAGPPLRVAPSQISEDAALHGRELLRFGYSVDQVVHDYGDLCQAVAELAIERRATISADEFKTLNRCLDHAIAGAVSEYDRRRDELVADAGARATNERLGFLAHELRNFLNTAMLAFAAVKSGSVGVNGATSRVIDRSLVGLRDLIDRSLADVRFASSLLSHPEEISLDAFIGEVRTSAMLAAHAKGCVLRIEPVAPDLAVEMDRQMLHAAVDNLLQNAFRFTHPGTQVILRTGSSPERVTIEVQDECGGLPAGKADSMFESFEQHHADRSGLGLGLSISRRAIEAGHGTLSVRDLPGHGCVFTIDLPRRLPQPQAQAGR